MKRVHNVRVRVIDRDKELIDRLLLQFLELSGVETEQATITYSDDGEADPLFIGELWLDRQPPVRKAIAMLVRRLGEDDKTTVRQHAERFIDTATHAFLRLDKAALLAGEVRFSDAASTVQVRINLAAFPATKERAVPMLRELFAEKRK